MIMLHHINAISRKIRENTPLLEREFDTGMPELSDFIFRVAAEQNTGSYILGFNKNKDGKEYDRTAN
jgi:hypothetical protein